MQTQVNQHEKSMTVQEQRAARAENKRKREESRKEEIKAKAQGITLERKRLSLQERELKLREDEAKRIREAESKAVELAAHVDKASLVATLKKQIVISDKLGEIVQAGKFLAQLEGWIKPEAEAPAKESETDPIIGGLMRGAADAHGVEKVLKSIGVNLEELFETWQAEREAKKS